MTLAILAFAVLSYWAYTTAVSFDVPWGDHWRWIRFGLMPLDRGDLSFYEFLTSEYAPFSHSHILTLLQLWINKSYFGLNYKLEMAIGSFSLVLLVITIACNRKYSVTQSAADNPAGWLTLLASTLVILNLYNADAWTLVHFESFYILIAFLFFLYADAHYDALRSSPGYFIWITVLFFLGDVAGVMSVLSVILYMLVFDFRRHKNTILLSILTLALAYALARTLFPVHASEGLSAIQGISYLLSNFDQVLALIVKVSAGSLFSEGSLFTLFGQGWQVAQYLIGLLVFVLISGALYLHGSSQQIRAYRFPLFLIFLAIVTLLGMLALRLPEFGISISKAARYTKLLQTGILGASLVFIFYFFFGQRTAKQSNLLSLTFLLVVMASLFFSYGAGQVQKWRYYPSIANTKLQAIDGIRRVGADPQHDLVSPDRRCDKSFCDNAIVYLKRGKRSVFRESQDL